MKNNPHSVDRFYKFCLKELRIKFYRFFFKNGMIIEFMETETAHTGQRKDAVVKIDYKKIHLIEFMASQLGDEKLYDIYDYLVSTSIDPEYKDYEHECDIISIAKPTDEIKKIKINKNIIFCIRIIFLKNMDGAKILSTLTDKIIMYEELTDNEAISLLLLPDMKIDIPLKQLLNSICILYGNANIPDIKFKVRIYSCLIMLFKRFYTGSELQEMINMLKTATQDQKVAKIVEKYGPGFDEVYYWGIEDGEIKILEKTAKKFIAEGTDLNLISRCTGFPIEKLKELKRKL